MLGSGEERGEEEIVWGLGMVADGRGWRGRGGGDGRTNLEAPFL